MFFLPFATDCERQRFPIVTVLLIVLNAAILGMQFAAGADRSAEVALVPATPTALGALLSMFMHADPFHLAGNMLFLWVFGSTLEDRLGTWLYLGLYMGGGICATVAHVAVAWLFQTGALEAPVVGASGAVAALVGMFATRFYQNRVRVFYLLWILIVLKWGTFELGALWVVGFFLGENLLFGLLDIGGIGTGVAYWAHLGGLFFGIASGLAMGLNREAGSEYESQATAAVFHNAPRDELAGLQARVAKDPDDLEAVLWLGQAYADAARWDDARDLWTGTLPRLLRETPPDRLLWFLNYANEGHLQQTLPPHLRYQIALALERAERYESANSWLEAVIQDPEGGESVEVALLRQAAIQRDRLGDAEGARQLLASFLERFPESRWGEQARRGWEELQAA